jgi:hypothetical protein
MYDLVDVCGDELLDKLEMKRMVTVLRRMAERLQVELKIINLRLLQSSILDM